MGAVQKWGQEVAAEGLAPLQKLVGGEGGDVGQRPTEEVLGGGNGEGGGGAELELPVDGQLVGVGEEREEGGGCVCA